MSTLDWIIDVHRKLKLCDETLFLFFQYFDEYCSKSGGHDLNLRLVAMTCLWIASKFEEVRCPPVASFSKISEGVMSLEEMKMVESDILLTLDYSLLKSTPLQMLCLALENQRGTQQ